MKKIRCILWSVALMLLFAVPVLADTGPEKKVYDQASLLSQEEADQLQSYAAELSAQYNAAFVVVTTDQNNDGTAQEYADSFLLDDYYGQTPHTDGYGDADGMLFLIDMDTRNYALSTVGSVYNAMGQSEVDELLDNAYYNMSEGNYYAACYQALADAGAAMAGYADDQAAAESAKVWMPIVIGLVGALIITIIVVVILINGSKKSKLATEAGAYLVSNSVHITGRNEIMTGTHTMVTPIPKDEDSGGGGGGSHISGGGATMGGGSRSF